MAAMTYQHCYRMLQLSADCGWSELRLAYRRKVRLCHPDRMPSDGDGTPNQDEEFKQVVLAYRLLAGFYKQYGELPPPWLVVDETTSSITMPPQQRQDGQRASRNGRERKPGGTPWRGMRWVPPRFHQAVFGAFVGGVCTAAVIGQLGQGADPDISTRNGELSVGMDPQSVVDVQGVPNYTKGSVWFYGESGVIFDRGCVVGWENQPPFPLRTLVRMADFPAAHSGSDTSQACAGN